MKKFRVWDFKIYFYFLIHREFRIEMREDPTSVFSSDIVIEGTDGPLDYDISRVYSGKLESEYFLRF
jgi:hypothetical protein